MRLVAAKRTHVGTLAALMAASPLLRRYGVTLRGARASLDEALRSQAWAGPILVVSLIGFAVTAGAIVWWVVLAPAGPAAAPVAGQPQSATR